MIADWNKSSGMSKWPNSCVTTSLDGVDPNYHEAIPGPDPYYVAPRQRLPVSPPVPSAPQEPRWVRPAPPETDEVTLLKQEIIELKATISNLNALLLFRDHPQSDIDSMPPPAYPMF